MDDLDGPALPIAWPDVPRIAFGPGDEWRLNACVDWVQSRRHDLGGYIDGYREAARAVFRQVDEGGSSPDHLVFPMAFLWRHHIELSLKDIIATGVRLMGEPWGFPSGHRLLALWGRAKPHVVQCGDPNAPELNNVEANIVEFERIDPGADGFRYPVSKDQSRPSLPTAPPLVNLRTLHEALEALANFFEGVRTELSLRFDYLVEMEAQYRDFDREPGDGS